MKITLDVDTGLVFIFYYVVSIWVMIVIQIYDMEFCKVPNYNKTY
jgi:hypothetical protein